MASVNVENSDNMVTFKDKVNELSGDVGDLATLTTTEQGSIVGAINEIVSEVTEKYLYRTIQSS